MDKELIERIDANYRAITALTDQIAQLVRERDALQKLVWRYEKHGVTCQTYGNRVDSSCSECNVHEKYPLATPSPDTNGTEKCPPGGGGYPGIKSSRLIVEGDK